MRRRHERAPDGLSQLGLNRGTQGANALFESLTVARPSVRDQITQLSRVVRWAMSENRRASIILLGGTMLCRLAVRVASAHRLNR